MPEHLLLLVLSKHFFHTYLPFYFSFTLSHDWREWVI
jgi:hypothetical protein